MKLLKRTVLPVLGLLFLAGCADDSNSAAYTKTTTTKVERGSASDLNTAGIPGTRY
jgi:uncharacterized lipoprotein YajG